MALKVAGFDDFNSQLVKQSEDSLPDSKADSNSASQNASDHCHILLQKEVVSDPEILSKIRYKTENPPDLELYKIILDNVQRLKNIKEDERMKTFLCDNNRTEPEPKDLVVRGFCSHDADKDRIACFCCNLSLGLNELTTCDSIDKEHSKKDCLFFKMYELEKEEQLRNEGKTEQLVCQMCTCQPSFHLTLFPCQHVLQLCSECFIRYLMQSGRLTCPESNTKFDYLAYAPAVQLQVVVHAGEHH